MSSPQTAVSAPSIVPPAAVPIDTLRRLPAQVISLRESGAIAGRYGGQINLDDVSAELVGEAEHSVVAVLGGISAHRHVVSHALDAQPGWWEWLIGPGCALDTRRFRILAMDWATVDGAPTDTADQAAALAALMDLLGIEKLAAIVGASYGGMVALAFGERRPALVERLVVLCAAHETHPMATARRVIQRRIVRLGESAGRPRDGVALARALAITTYRTDAEFAERFGSGALDGDAPPRFPVESYLEHCGERFATTWESDRYCALSESLDLHHSDPASITVPVWLLGVDGDTIAPPTQMRALRDALAGPATLDVIVSRYGHDAFLKEEAAVSDFVRRALGWSHACREPTSRPPATAHDARRMTLDARAATRAVRAGIATDQHHHAVVPPIHLSSTFAFEGFGRKGAYDYTRSGNPTRDHLAEALADLEHGAGGIVTSSGMSAVALVLQLLVAGDLVLAAHDCYGGTHRALVGLAKKGHFSLRRADLTAPDAPAKVRESGARLVWVETPSNPLLRLTDIRAVSAAAHAAGALVVVDNTFLSPALQRPIELGADIVVHSTTKYLNGHSDVVGGGVVARDASMHQELAWWANCLGLGGAPFDSFLTLRGLRTLEARMRIHIENAGRIAGMLDRHPAVSAVYYPGLPSHPRHELARVQQRGFGAMISFELEGGESAVERFLSRLRYFTLAESLGGVESLIAHPATMTHASMDAEARAVAGISDALLRISVGIEDGDDLERDLEKGLGMRSQGSGL
ncbi:MAG TPA: cystathionine gamma-synthase [Gemmatimonadales bacterium]|nr:cystathionine gamma-synthase [Gemmatimonadales bacterium]